MVVYILVLVASQNSSMLWIRIWQWRRSLWLHCTWNGTRLETNSTPPDSRYLETRWNCYHLFNTLWPTDIIWWHRSGPTFAQEMACCLMAPSHYLNQCWLIIKGIVWPSTQSNFVRSAHELLTTSLRGQWVNSLMPKGNKELSQQ